MRWAAELMDQFYFHLLNGETRLEALRLAQRYIRKEYRRADPRYWGAFICQGDTGTLPHREA